MPSQIHELGGFWDRVNFASAVIARNGEPTRNFDTCFEMYDGNAVAAAVVRRAKANPDGPLARNLFPRYLGPRAIESYEATKHLSRKQLDSTPRTCARKLFAHAMLGGLPNALQEDWRRSPRNKHSATFYVGRTRHEGHP